MFERVEITRAMDLKPRSVNLNLKLARDKNLFNRVVRQKGKGLLVNTKDLGNTFNEYQEQSIFNTLNEDNSEKIVLKLQRHTDTEKMQHSLRSNSQSLRALVKPSLAENPSKPLLVQDSI